MGAQGHVPLCPSFSKGGYIPVFLPVYSREVLQGSTHELYQASHDELQLNRSGLQQGHKQSTVSRGYGAALRAHCTTGNSRIELERAHPNSARYYGTLCCVIIIIIVRFTMRMGYRQAHSPNSYSVTCAWNDKAI